MCVRGVRLWDFSHLDWQKLNFEQYSPLPHFRSKSSRFVKLVQYLTTVVEALNMQASQLLLFLVEPTTLLPLVRRKISDHDVS